MGNLRAVLVVAALLAVGCHIIHGPGETSGTRTAEGVDLRYLKVFGLKLLYQTPALKEPVVDAYLTADHLMLQTAGVKLYAIHREKGLIAWVAVLPAHTEFRVGADQQCYYVVAHGQLLALNKMNGKELWRKQLGVAASSAPAAGAAYVYLGSQDRRVVAVPKADELGWRFTTGGVVSTTPVVTPLGIYVGCSDGVVYCIDRQKQGPSWEFATDGPVQADLVVLSDTVFVASTDHKLYALNAGMQVSRRYQQRWLLPYGMQSPVVDPLVLAGDTLYVQGQGLGVHAINPEIGTAKWVYARGAKFVARGDAGIYVVSKDRKLVLVNTETGAEQAEFNVSAYKFLPTNTDTDVIFLVTGNGAIAACEPQ
jgi:outer membrane protein assembly factor BamB